MLISCPRVSGQHGLAAKRRRQPMNPAIQVLSLLLCTGLLPAAQNERIIDLTGPVNRPSPLRFPGVSAGSTSGGRRGPGIHSIPVQIRLLQARYDEATRRLLVEVSLQNIGKQAIAIPVSRDAEVHRDGHRDWRLLVFRLQLQSGNNSGTGQVAGVTFGSGSVADSLHELPPGQSLRFLMALPHRADAVPPPVNNSRPMTLQAACYEQLTSDSDYIITSQSAIIVSPPAPPPHPSVHPRSPPVGSNNKHSIINNIHIP